jgi:malate/lactate dehydrogenase
MSDRAEKIGIVGAGSVGATIAYACIVRGVGKHISLFDLAKTKVEAEVLDLNHTDSEIAILQSYLRKTKEAALSYPCFDVAVSMGSQKPRNEQGDQNASTRR